MRPDGEARWRGSGEPGMVLLYVVTLFVSAVLLFAIQPMVGKMVLPLLGGTPAVWNTCMVFFQLMLLAGYAYAHASAAWLGGRRQALLHIVLLISALSILPINLAGGISPPTQDYPILWLLGRLAITVGLPFFVVAGTSPLLQKWFSGTRHRYAHDPYFLYAASNTGSLLALLSYPIVIEPLLDLHGQAHMWRIGYYALIALVLACTLTQWRRNSVSLSAPNDPQVPTMDPAIALTWRQRAWWVALAAVPSSLMLGVTLHITTNVAAMPLLWVLPLSLYLLTFVLAFARRRVIPADLVSRLLPAVVLLMGPLFFVTLPELEWRLTLAHLAMFFMAALVCHNRLAGSRPQPRHLTEYYLWIALGGVLGGIFNSMIAPLVFRTVIEYPLMVAAACLLRIGPTSTAALLRTRRLDWLLPIILAVVALAAAVGLNASAWKGWAGAGLAVPSGNCCEHYLLASTDAICPRLCSIPCGIRIVRSAGRR